MCLRWSEEIVDQAEGAGAVLIFCSCDDSDTKVGNGVHLNLVITSFRQNVVHKLDAELRTLLKVQVKMYFQMFAFDYHESVRW